MKIKFTAKITRIEEKFDKQHVKGVGPDALFVTVSQGWFVSFEGSYEAIFIGMDKPTAMVGDPALLEITFP